MNPYMLLSFPLPVVLREITRENDKTRVYSAYIPNMYLNEEQPRVSRSKFHFDEIKRSIRVNPDLPM